MKRKNFGLPLEQEEENSVEIEKLTCYWDKVSLFKVKLTFHSKLCRIIFSFFFFLSECGCSVSAERLRHCKVTPAHCSCRTSGGRKGQHMSVHLIIVFIAPSLAYMRVTSLQSSLLSAILGELPHEVGTLKVKGRLIYASQQPWVFPGTIRSNILFGRDFHPKKYEKVLKACALNRVRHKRFICRYIIAFILLSLSEALWFCCAGLGGAPRWRSDADRRQRCNTQWGTESPG